MRMNKKGQAIENVQAMVIPILVIGVILAIGFLIWAEAKDQAAVMVDQITVTNGSFTFANNTLIGLNSSMTLECSAVYNGSGLTAVEVLSANYTCAREGIKILDDSNCGSGNTACNFNTTMAVTYAFRPLSSAWNATGQVQTAASDIPGWLPIIVITVIGAILIGIVSVFRRQ